MLPPWDPSVKHCLGSQPVAWFVYRRRSNCASFLIGRQNTTFQTGNFQWCVTLRKLISYCCITQISWLQTWTVIVACHRWCIKPRYIPDMVETFLVLRDSNGNRNSSPMFFFSVWHHLRIPRVSKNMDASCRRKTNNGKRTRKRTRLIRFKRGNAIKIRNGIMLKLPYFIQISTTLLTRFPRYRKRSILRELVEVGYNTHFRLFSLPFLHLALLRDGFHRCFLIMRHISIVAS